MLKSHVRIKINQGEYGHMKIGVDLIRDINECELKLS